MKWVHINETRLEGGKLSPKTVATVVLEDGVVRIEGDSAVAKELRERGVSAAQGEVFTAADGEQFLMALGEKYRSAYLSATGVEEGPAVVPYQPPELKKAA